MEEKLVQIGLSELSESTAQNRQESIPEHGESPSFAEDKVGEVEFEVDNLTQVSIKQSTERGLGNTLPAKAYILYYWKEGAARFLSHLNVMRLIERAMLRSGFKLRFTEGFNPHPKFATSPAIPLGMSSRSEYVQFEHYGELPEDAVKRMNECLIDGLCVQSIEPMEKGRGAITQPLQVTYRANYPAGPVNGDGDALSRSDGTNK